MGSLLEDIPIIYWLRERNKLAGTSFGEPVQVAIGGGDSVFLGYSRLLVRFGPRRDTYPRDTLGHMTCSLEAWWNLPFELGNIFE